MPYRSVYLSELSRRELTFDTGREFRSYSIGSYGWRAEERFPFMGNPPDERYFGIELEVQGVRRFSSSELSYSAGDTVNLLGDDYVLVKPDGSVSNGYEICTAPATLEIHRERWDRFLSAPNKHLKVSAQQCGMHIHVSRPEFPHLLRIMKFMYTEENRQAHIAVAGRDSRWGRLQHISRDETGLAFYRRAVNRHAPGPLTSNHESWETWVANKDCHGGGDRYVAVNNSNKKTIEFRLFAGITDPVKFMKNLEFVHAVVYYTEMTPQRRSSWEGFMDFVKDNASIYPNFIRWYKDHWGVRAFNAGVPRRLRNSVRDTVALETVTVG